MIVMPANNSHAHTLNMVFPGRLGLIMCPSGKRDPKNLPWCADSEMYAAWAKSNFSTVYNDIMTHWDSAAFCDFIPWISGQFNRPRFVTVPDVPGNAKLTLQHWNLWYPQLAETGLPLAMCVQDGMTPDDVPEGIIAFIGGTKKWKLKNVKRFCDGCERVHVGRINNYEHLWLCHDAGAESCDGSGFFRGDQRQQRGLIAYLLESDGHKERGKQLQMFEELELV